MGEEMNKTVMVTGSRGYIGSNLCNILIEQGYSVLQLDKKIGSNVLDATFPRSSVHAIVHLAAIASIGECEEDVKQTIRDNILTCRAVSSWGAHHGIPIYFASSQAVKNPTSSTYAMTKLIGEEIFKYSNKYVILRFANVYGGINYINDKTSVVANFTRAYKDGAPLMVNGDGTQTRDFVHVNDICKTILKCIETDQCDITLDVGTGKETSIIDLAKMYTGSEIQMNPNSDLIGVSSNVADIEELKKIKVEPSMVLEDFVESIL